MDDKAAHPQAQGTREVEARERCALIEQRFYEGAYKNYENVLKDIPWLFHELEFRLDGPAIYVPAHQQASGAGEWTDDALRAALAEELAGQKLPKKLQDCLTDPIPNEPWLLCCLRAMRRVAFAPTTSAVAGSAVREGGEK